MKGGTAGFDFACQKSDHMRRDEVLHFDLEHDCHGEKRSDSRRQPSAPFVRANLPVRNACERGKFCLLKLAVSVPGAVATDVQGESAFFVEGRPCPVVRDWVHS